MDATELKTAILSMASRPGGATVGDITAALHEPYSRVMKAIERMRFPKHGPKLIYVADWAPTGARPKAVFMPGGEPDVRPPPKMTGAERARRYRENMSPEQRDFLRARDRARHWRPKRDNLTVALFGAYRRETTK